jgi:hypothetical protein
MLLIDNSGNNVEGLTWERLFEVQSFINNYLRNNTYL